MKNKKLKIFIILIFVVVSILCVFKIRAEPNNFKVENKILSNIIQEVSDYEKIKNEELQSEFQENIYEWKIEIPIIELNAPIAEGIEMDTLNKYVGHFEESQKLEGNIALAGHNRGYDNNYFAKVKELKVRDEITYTYNGNIKTYVIDVVSVIDSTDWSVIENTNENRITLITCVENEPQYRRCIRGIEK